MGKKSRRKGADDWSGPSKSNPTSERRGRKEARRVERAGGRNAPTRVAGTNILSSQGLSEVLDKTGASDLVRVAPKDANPVSWGQGCHKDEEWARRASLVREKMYERRNAGNFPEFYHGVDKEATTIIDEIKADMLANPSSYQHAFSLKDGDGYTTNTVRTKTSLPSALMDAFFHRTIARYCLGGLYDANGDAKLGHEFHTLSVEDATETLSLRKMISPDHSEEDIIMFHHRGIASRSLKEYDSSIEDLRAGCLAIKAAGGEWAKNQFPSIGEMTTALLISMADKKMESGATRPFYSKDEQEKLEEDLGLGLYEEASYKCAACGECLGKEMKKCSGCHRIWLCGKACHRAAWKAGHKHKCAEFASKRNISVLPDHCRSMFEERINDHGSADVFDAQTNRPAVFVKDTKTGRFFDSLSDSDLFFVPSENHLMAERMTENMLANMNIGK